MIDDRGQHVMTHKSKTKFYLPTPSRSISTTKSIRDIILDCTLLSSRRLTFNAKLWLKDPLVQSSKLWVYSMSNYLMTSHGHAIFWNILYFWGLTQNLQRKSWRYSAHYFKLQVLHWSHINDRNWIKRYLLRGKDLEIYNESDTRMKHQPSYQRLLIWSKEELLWPNMTESR